ncbi:MAG: YicC family protein [bacterium]|nr:YicC family protein [bacterium]
MAVKSMTGFARDDGAIGRYNWYWEIRTVNGKGRDIRMRLPPGYDKLEAEARSLVAKNIIRGNCNLTLKVNCITGNQEIKINENGLKQVAKAIRKADMFVDASQPSIDGILALRGVLEVVEPEHSPSEREELEQALLASLNMTMDKVVLARNDEGQHLFEAISAHIEQIETHLAEIENSKTRSVKAIQARLQEQVQKLLDTDTGLSQERLHQEAVLLATKADLEEEVVRLKAHIISARELLLVEGAVGRKFDFLTQEFNREANTICSKSTAIDVTNAGLELKTIIDQMKEQVQNIE